MFTRDIFVFLNYASFENRSTRNFIGLITRFSYSFPKQSSRNNGWSVPWRSAIFPQQKCNNFSVTEFNRGKLLLQISRNMHFKHRFQYFCIWMASTTAKYEKMMHRSNKILSYFKHPLMSYWKTDFQHFITTKTHFTLKIGKKFPLKFEKKYSLGLVQILSIGKFAKIAALI